MLNDPAQILTPNSVRSLMSLVLMACYDRNVEREFIAEMIDHTAEVNILMSKLEAGAKMRAAFSMLKPGLPLTQIDAELEGLCKQWNKRKSVIAQKFNLLMECASTLDTLH